MIYLEFFLNLIFERPGFYFLAIIFIITFQLIVSFSLNKIRIKFLKNRLGNKTIFSVLVSLIAALPGTYYLTQMMCFTATNMF